MMMRRVLVLLAVSQLAWVTQVLLKQQGVDPVVKQPLPEPLAVQVVGSGVGVGVSGHRLDVTQVPF